MNTGRAFDSLRPAAMEKGPLRIIGALVLLLGSGCGASVATTTYELECETGTLGCSCYGNWSCNYQLSCVEDVCVDRKSEPPTTDKELSLSESPPDPLAQATTLECIQCLQQDCSTSLEACYPEAGCIALQACLFKCSNDDTSSKACAYDCALEASATAEQKSVAVTECAARECAACGSDS